MVATLIEELVADSPVLPDGAWETSCWWVDSRQRLGHTGTSVMRNTYGHWLPEQDREAADVA